MLINTNKSINNPKINQVVFYQPPRTLKHKDKKPYPVIINDGCYLSNNRLSNFWEWQKLTPSGRFRCIEYGYGKFTIAKGYEIQRKVKLLK